MSKIVSDHQSGITQVLNFYGLSCMPFGKEIHWRDIFQTSTLKNASAMLEMGVETEDILLLSGPVGSGKSVTIRNFISTIDTNRYSSVYIHGYVKTATGLCKMILKELLIDPPFNPVKSKSLYSKSIMDMPKKPVIILDDAQDMSDNALLSIKSLVNFNQDSTNKVTIILSGQPELKDKLSFSMFSAIRQRIKLNIILEPITLKETCEYIDHSLQICGRPNTIFSDNAKSEIYKISSGIPRVINKICFQALIQGTIKKKDIIDSGDIPFEHF